MTADRETIVTRAPRTRSRVTNGRRLFVEADARSGWSRRYRDLTEMFTNDAGGAETLTELRLALCRRAAALTVECERLEGKLAEGESVDIDLLARMSSHLRRIAESIGLDRVTRDREPSLREIVEAHVNEARRNEGAHSHAQSA